MNRWPTEGVRAASARVALVTTAIVAAVYTVIALVVVVIATRNLTSDIDGRLNSALARYERGAVLFFPGGALRLPAGGPRFGPPLLVWVVQPDGTVLSNDTSAVLPADERNAGEAHTASIGGTSLRVAGTQIGDDHVVVGQSMESVAKARSTVVLAEVVVGPILLAAVFLGALTIGRRVAAPIELARQRQMAFTADASHELRTPLSVIEAQTSLALSQERDSAWYRRAFERVDAESGRIRRLVEDLLWLARFDATKGQPHAEPVDVGVLAHAVADRFAAVAESRGLELTVSTAGDGLVVTAPPEWLDRLCGVLLDNACKYSPDRGRVDVSVHREGGRVRWSVDDSGPGIPPEERTRIFDRFHRATDRPGGAGLGLAIADAVVRATGGRWDVGVSPAGGASMAVSWPSSLPASREPARTAPLPTPSPQ